MPAQTHHTHPTATNGVIHPKPAVRNPITHHFEFLGPHLSPLVIAGLAVAPTLLNALGAGAIDLLNTLKSLVSSAADLSKLASASIVILFFHAIPYYLVPCHWISGTHICNRTILNYPINAIASLVATYASLDES